VCLCSPLNYSSDLKNYLEYIVTGAAQYNYDAPRYLMSDMCRAIDGAANGTDTLGRIYAGVVAYKQNLSLSCYDVNEYSAPSETNDGWGWQVYSFLSYYTFNYKINLIDNNNTVLLE
jgi:lysosomal Pro-X carboxypeptidase